MSIGFRKSVPWHVASSFFTLSEVYANQCQPIIWPNHSNRPSARAAVLFQILSALAQGIKPVWSRPWSRISLSILHVLDALAALTILVSKSPGELNTPCFVTQLIFLGCTSASWICKTDNQHQGRICTPKEQQFACYTSSLLISTSYQTARKTVTTPSSLSPSLSFTLQPPNLRGETVLSLYLALDASGFALRHGWGPQLLNQHLAGVSSDYRVSISCLCCTHDGLG